MAAVSFFINFFSFFGTKRKNPLQRENQTQQPGQGIPNLSTPFYQAQVFYVDLGTTFKGSKTLILLFYASS
jgi:hypothetical protein